jgi:hypothetical protein
MKVIQAGTPWGKEIECTGAGNSNVGCGAKLLVGQGDLYQTSHQFIDGSTDYYTTFCCPCCGAETDIKPPSGVKLMGTQPSKEERKELMRRFNKSQIAPIRESQSSLMTEKLAQTRFPVEEIEWR